MIKLFAALMFALSVSANAEPVKLKLAWVFTDKEISFQSGPAKFIKAVNEDPEAKGIIEIAAFANGSLGRVPSEQPQLVDDGIADIVHISPSYSPGRFPELEVLELPGLLKDMREATMVFTSLVASGRVKSYGNFVPLLTVGNPPFIVHTVQPINSLADLKGKKIRSSGVTLTSTVRALGAVPVGLAISELAESLGRGTIDGLTTQLTVVYDTQLDRLVNNQYVLNTGGFQVTMLMSKKKFDSLPAQAQRVIMRHSGKVLNEQYMQGVEQYTKTLNETIKADPKKKVVIPSAADQKTADDAFRSVQDVWIQRRPENAELFKFVQSELVKIRASNR